jgi:ABC-type bacteriocin/lantibiotic exporter with double-glycine peptidase domain
MRSKLGVFGKILALCDHKERRSLYALLALFVVNGMIDTLGVSSIMPFLLVLTSPDSIQSGTLMMGLYDLLGKPEKSYFLLMLGGAATLLLVLSNAMAAISASAMFRFTFRQGASMSSRLLSKYLYQPYAFYLNRNTMDLTRNVYDEVGRVVSGVMLPYLLVIARTVVAISLVALLVMVHWKIALICSFVFSGAYLLIHRLLKKQCAAGADVAARMRAALMKEASDALSSVKEVKMLGLESRWINQFSNAANQLAKAETENQIYGALPKYILETIAFGGVLLIILVMIFSGVSTGGVLPVVSVFAFAGYRMLPAMQQIFSNYNYVNFYKPSLDLIVHDLCGLKSGNNEFVEQQKLLYSQTVALNSIRFCYPNANEKVIDGVSIEIPRGTMIAIVGGSGSGKSTLLDILLGLLRPEEGTVSVDGQEVSDDLVRAWQQNIGFVPQQIHMLDDTIKQNIAFGERGVIDVKKVRDAAIYAGIAEFVENELPLQFDTQVGDRGVRLSGGQRQRIGLARALYRSPSLLVLDEATSALDNKTEKEIMDSLRKIAENSSVILVAHRLSTTRYCDQIYVLDQGKVVDQGTYTELENAGGLFSELLKAGQGGVGIEKDVW